MLAISQMSQKPPHRPRGGKRLLMMIMPTFASRKLVALF
jgi:hypothetical protein